MDSYGLLCIVDDDADYRFVVQQVFNRFLSAYSVQFFPGGNALLDELPNMKQKPGLILLDRHMPGLDGHQTLLHLKQHPAYQKIPVVMMSADASSLEIDNCYEVGVNSFLLKKKGLIPLRDALSTLCQYWLELNWEPIKERVA